MDVKRLTMKTLMLISVILLVGGCGKGNQTVKESAKATPSNTKFTEDNNTKPIKADDNNATKLTPEEQKVAGEYEIKTKGGDGIEYTERVVLLENGILILM